MSHNAVAVRPPMANLAAPSRNSRRLMPPCTYLWKRLSSCGSKSLAFFLSIQLTPLNSVRTVRRLAQPALKINLSLQERRRLKSLSGSGYCSRAVSSSTTHRRGPRPGPWILAQGRPEREESRDHDFLGQNPESGRLWGFEAFVSEPE